MNSADSNDLSPEALVALRNDPDAMRIITERLKVKEMGPGDHIRTKHEVKAFLEASGGVAEAEELLKRASERRIISETVRESHRLNRGQTP